MYDFNRLICSGVLCALLAAPQGCFTGCPDDDRGRFCLRAGSKDCGEVTSQNLCGEVQTILCGSCQGDDICGGNGVPNVCNRCTHPAVKAQCATDWCKVPAGCFQMGTSVYGDCQPFVDPGCGLETQHETALTHSFEIMATEVLQKDFKALMGYAPFKNENQPASASLDLLPADYISWHEAAAYANALSSKMGRTPCYACSGSGAFVSCAPAEDYRGKGVYGCPGYRLPTEAEWEYAYRAGSQTSLYSSSLSGCPCGDGTPPAPKCDALDKIGWWGGNSQGHHHPSKQKAANAWGLYDMTGNVWEWCHDGFEKDLGSARVSDPVGLDGAQYRVLRGGGFAYPSPKFLRGAVRRRETPDHHCVEVGFRLVRTLQAGPL